MQLKRIVIIYVLIHLSTQVFAQSVQDKRETKFGFKLGYVNANVYGSQIDNYKDGDYEFNSRHGISAGLTLKQEIYNWIYSKVELNYFQKGAEIGESNFIYPPRPYFTYLNIPLILGAQIDLQPKGLQLGFEFGLANNLEIANDENLDEGLYYTIYPEYSKHIIEINYGVIFSYELDEKMSITFNLRRFRDLNYFFKRIDYFPSERSGSMEREFWVAEMKHIGFNFNFGINYKI